MQPKCKGNMRTSCAFPYLQTQPTGVRASSSHLAARWRERALSVRNGWMTSTLNGALCNERWRRREGNILWALSLCLSEKYRGSIMNTKVASLFPQ